MQRLPSTGSDLITAIAAALAVGAVAAFAATGHHVSRRSRRGGASRNHGASALPCHYSTHPVGGPRRPRSVSHRSGWGGRQMPRHVPSICYSPQRPATTRATTAPEARSQDGCQTTLFCPRNLPESFGDTGTDWLSYMVGWLYYFTGPNRVTCVRRLYVPELCRHAVFLPGRCLGST